MPILLFRVDERLIHGQVVIGWGRELRPDRYVVVDDELAGSDWEQELYALSLSEGEGVAFRTVAEARDELDAWRDSPDRAVVLVRNLESLVRLAREEALAGEQVNLGGLHHAAGREEVLPYLFLDAEDRERLRTLAAEGVVLSARDLPGSPRVELEALLER